jgi:cell division septal protein FtsQ
MGSRSRLRRKWHKFRRERTALFFVSAAVLLVIILMALLMWVLTDVRWRARW